MRALFYIILFISRFSPVNAQLEKRGASKEFYIYENAVVVVANNFIQERDSSNGIFHSYVTGVNTQIQFAMHDMKTSLPGMASGFKIIRKSNQSLQANDIEVRIKKNGNVVRDWQNISSYPPHFTGFMLANEPLEIQETLVADGRSKMSGKILFTYYVQRIAKPLQPLLAMSVRDSSGADNRITEKLINQYLLKKDSILGRIDTFYRDWTIPFSIREEKLFPTSKLILFFAKSDSHMADSTLEWRLTGSRDRETGWKKSGHMIYIDNLRSNSHYTLEVRYAGHPKGTIINTFNVQPYWYEKDWLKWASGLVGGLLLVLVVLVIYRRKLLKEKERKEGISLQLKAIRAQLNPHFIFNALNSIQGLINKQQTDAASQYIADLGKLMRETLNGNYKEYNSLSNELSLLDTYLKLEQVRFGFQYAIEMDQGLKISQAEIPSLLLQPLVENAIRHGVSGMRDRGLVTIHFTKNQNDLQIIITDNGGNYKEAIGDGLRLTRERINLLNEINQGRPISFVMRAEEQKTTFAQLTFKNWL